MVAFGRSLRLAAVLALVIGVLGPSPAQAAPLCAYDSGARTLTVTAQLTLLDFATGGGYLTVNDTNCALLSEVNKVNVDLAGIANVVVIWDLANGPFGPGFTDEGNGSSEIEWDVTGMTTGHALNVLGSSNADGVTVGSLVNGGTGLVTQQINLDALADGSIPDVDVVVHGAPGQMKLYGYAGDDTLKGGGTGTIGSRAYFYPMTLDAGDGRDTVLGGLSPDTLFIDISLRDSQDTYAGGGDTDSAYLGVADGFIVTSYISLDDRANDGIECPNFLRCEGDNYASDIERVYGSPLSDRLVGNDGPQTLNGGGGNDTIDGLAGNDTINGLDGNDTLQGGDGNDTIRPGLGDDTVQGGAGTDSVSYSDVAAGVTVNLSLAGAQNTVGAGIDTIGTTENASGTNLNDALTGTTGNNTLTGKGGADTITGGDGNDTLYPGIGDDTVNGGVGTDRVSYSDLTAGVTVNLTTPSTGGAAGTDVLSLIERATGTNFVDTLTGTNLVNILNGLGGNDSIFGLDGNDTLDGGLNTDSLDGGIGTDTCRNGETLTNCEL
jgi:Ca2+-binding RTX toxin-like protein